MVNNTPQMVGMFYRQGQTQGARGVSKHLHMRIYCPRNLTYTYAIQESPPFRALSVGNKSNSQKNVSGLLSRSSIPSDPTTIPNVRGYGCGSVVATTALLSSWSVIFFVRFISN